eukprot:2928441-Alexandrium_andersonii.AAC.1
MPTSPCLVGGAFRFPKVTAMLLAAWNAWGRYSRLRAGTSGALGMPRWMPIPQFPQAHWPAWPQR